MKSVTVHVHDTLTLEQSQKVLAHVLGKVGHPTCISGINISFQNIVDPPEIFTVDKQLNVNKAG